MYLQGALVGGITGLSLVTWMSIGTQVQMANGAISFPKKPVSVSGCSENWSLNNTYTPSTYSEPMYDISIALMCIVL